MGVPPADHIVVPSVRDVDLAFFESERRLVELGVTAWPLRFQDQRAVWDFNPHRVRLFHSQVGISDGVVESNMAVQCFSSTILKIDEWLFYGIRST
jgi:hypothetical protein